MKEAICITGLGAVTPLGNDPRAVFNRLMRGDTGIDIGDFVGSAPTPVAKAEFDATGRLSKVQLIGTDRVSQMALLASASALADAGISELDEAVRVGVYCGSSLGGITTFQKSLELHAAGKRLPPTTIPAVMPNGPAAAIAITNKIGGPVISYAVACASSAIAIAEAKRAIERGDVDVALAGGAEAPLLDSIISAWHSLQTLATANNSSAKRCAKPFSTDRTGFVLGEGAAFLVLEKAESARQKGKRVYAQIAGAGISCDGSHLTKPNVDGQIRAIKLALSEATLKPDQIGYCNAHGTGTITGDPVECQAMRSIWGDLAPQRAISSTKSAHGHLIGAAGALEAMITALSIHTGCIPPTASTTDVAPECSDLLHILGEGVNAPHMAAAISNSFAFGGTNISLVLRKHLDA